MEIGNQGLINLCAIFPWHGTSGSATPERARAFALAEIPPPWQSKVVILKWCNQDILTVLADATDDLSMPCHEQRPSAPSALDPRSLIYCYQHWDNKCVALTGSNIDQVDSGMGSVSSWKSQLLDSDSRSGNLILCPFKWCAIFLASRLNNGLFLKVIIRPSYLIWAIWYGPV